MVSKIQVTNDKIPPAIVANTASRPSRSASPVAPAKADTVSGDGRTTLAVVSEAVRVSGPNPFDALAAAAVGGAAPELRLSGACDATSESCEPSLATLTLITQLEARLAPRDAWGASRVRDGYMHITYDAQEERLAKSSIDRDASENLAQLLTGKGDAQTVIHAQEWRAAVGNYFKGGDVNAFVQQVLRECYLMGNLDMQMYAERVKSLNELKKAIRAEADRARKRKTEWATTANADPNWVSPAAYQTVVVDSAQMALLPAVQPALGGAELESHEDGDVAIDVFFSEGSALPLTAQSELKDLQGYRPDDLRKKLGAIEQHIEGMNAYDIEHYLIPLLESLNAGEHAGGIVQLIEKLDPKQVLVVASFGFVDGSGFIEDLKPEEAARLRTVERNATLTLFGEAIGDDKLGTSVFQDEAQSLLAKLRGPAPEDLAVGRHMGERDLSGWTRQAAGQTASEPKTVNTVAAMEDYLKTLEEDMNSIGDDSQLANIDLQNCLQKQQQTMQMMSNISKVLHDVTMAIIRNMNS